MSKPRTQAQTDAVVGYVQWLLGQMECSDWRIALKDDPLPSDDDAFAEVRMIHGRKLADLLLCHDFFEQPLCKQRHVLIHEICHLLLRDISELTQSSVIADMGRAQYTTFQTWFSHAVEVACDTLAYAFEELVQDHKYADELDSVSELPSGEPRRVVSAAPAPESRTDDHSGD